MCRLSPHKLTLMLRNWPCYFSITGTAKMAYQRILSWIGTNSLYQNSGAHWTNSLASNSNSLPLITQRLTDLVNDPTKLLTSAFIIMSSATKKVGMCTPSALSVDYPVVNWPPGVTIPHLQPPSGAGWWRLATEWPVNGF